MKRGKERKEAASSKAHLRQILLQPLDLRTDLLSPILLLLLPLPDLLQRPRHLPNQMSNLVALLLEFRLELFGRESQRGEVCGEGFELGVESFGGLGKDGCWGREEVREEIFLRKRKGEGEEGEGGCELGIEAAEELETRGGRLRHTFVRAVRPYITPPEMTAMT